MHASKLSCVNAFFSAGLLAACSNAHVTDSGLADVARGGLDPFDASGAAVRAAMDAEVSSMTRQAAMSNAAANGVAADPYLAGHPVAARSIGHTSYVLKVRLDSGLAAAYKPRSRLPLGDRRYRGEIAAYRLGRALGLSNVPLAMPRAFAAAELRAAFGTKDGAEEFDRKALVEPGGKVRGALIPWIDRYEELPLETRAERRRWEPWLTDPNAQIPAQDRPLACALSTMLAFDYVTGNWDRFSGGNVVRDGATGTLLFVDNDGAFYESPPSLARQAELLARVIRFSRSFVARLRDLDATMLRDVLGYEAPAEPLLPAQTIDQVDARRRTVLRFVDAATARWGEPAALAFE